MKHTLSILEKLISFESITPKSSGSVEYIAELLEEAGFNCDIQIFGEKEEVTHNLYAKYGKGVPNICFAGHIDVVPPMQMENWSSDPFKLTIKDDEIYGRGAVDMKGAVAVSLAVVLDYLKNTKNFKGSVSFLLTSDEEGKATYGTKAMLEYLSHEGEKIDFCILGEPTYEKQIGDTIKIGRRGSVNFELVVEGIQGHVAYPEKAQNPLTSLVKIASDLMGINFNNYATTGSKGSKNLRSSLKLPDRVQYDSCSKTNLEITSIDVGNNVTNIIPQNAKMKFNIRFDNLHNSDSLIALVTKTITAHEVEFNLKHHVSAESFMQEYSPEINLFANIVAKECNMKPNIASNGGTSDARFIHKYSQVVEFGLNSSLAHKINEYTKISDLQILYNVYYTSLTELFKEQ